MRSNPRISLNKLAEYIVARPARQRTIIKDQKHPSDFIVARYRLAEEAIRSFILQPQTNSLQNAISTISALAHNSDWSKQNAELCQDALIYFMTLKDRLTFDGLLPSLGSDNAPKMHVSGVDISVRPDILLNDSHGNIVGALKLYINKSFPLNDESGKYISTVLYRYIADNISSESNASPQLCIVVDVFAQHIYQAAKTYKRSMSDIQAACETISILWTAL